MAFPYRGPQSPRDEPTYTSYSSNPMSPQRDPHRLSGGMYTTGDVRGNMTRRFTMNALPTLSPIGVQRRQAAGEVQLPSGQYGRIPPSERKIRHIEGLLEQQRRINAELEQVDESTRREVEQALHHERAVSQMIAQSEPTTPPAYQDSFQPTFARTNRYSTASLTSPPNVANRPNRSSTQLTSPSSGYARPYTASASVLPSQSVPGSRRQSDDEEEEDEIRFGFDNINRAAANTDDLPSPNRNSMPVTSYDRKRNAADLSSTLGPLNTTSFFFDDDSLSQLPKSSLTKPSPPDTKTFLQMQHTADGFPKLIRREENGELVSGSSAALDLALSQNIGSDKPLTDRVTATRHRISLPPSALSSNGTIAPLNSILASANDSKIPSNNRRSMEVKFAAETKRPSLLPTPPRPLPNGIPQSSYSTNDIPTLKSINGERTGTIAITSPPSQHGHLADPAQSQNRNPLGRSTTGFTAASYRQSQDYSLSKPSETVEALPSPPSGNLQANAPPFGPTVGHFSGQMQFAAANVSSMSPYAQQPAFHAPYGMHMLNGGFANMNIGGGYGGLGQWPNQSVPFQQPAYGGYQQFQPAPQAVAGAGRHSENNRPNVHQRKTDAEQLYSSVELPELRGQIYGLCKDQHGCRFLQKKLEERNEQDVQVIFEEVKDHFTELMTDPFGNYLCQRLLEHTNDEQRTALVKNAVPAMTKIALNQHGTRALQKMIEYLSTADQIQLVIDALRHDVVQLIQDLNGNHVIQKCLNHLSAQDAQFIFDAVGAHCVIVGTHRHGCCVLQRCVDHATGYQKGDLVEAIVSNAFPLVQDPFGNYVVQYIIDLAEPSFTEPLCRSMVGHVVILSKQKFSSNVIEKCIRSASPETRRILISEIAAPNEVEKLLRDSFANYVVQTAMDFADDDIKAILVERIRPMLPAIRHTPHGRRIQTKVQDYDGGSIVPPGASAPEEPSGAYPPNALSSGRANRMGMIGAPPQWANNNSTSFGLAPSFVNGGAPEMTSPTPQRAQTYHALDGTQGYSSNGFAGPPFAGSGRQPPAYGHF